MADVALVQPPLRADSPDWHRYVDWGAIFAGTAFASAISVVLIAFGTAAGFSLTSPFEDKTASRFAVMLALGFWILIVIVFSSMAGGYVGGRLRRRISDATEHEIEVRDGVHGLVIWGVGVLLAALLSAAGVSSLVKTTTAPTNPRMDPVAYVTDRLLRTDDGRPVEASLRDQIARLLSQGAVRGDLTTDDRSYLAHVVAARTGLSLSEAQERVGRVLTDAKKTADQVRHGTVVLAFIIAAALVAGAACAAYGAVVGGRHRDNATVIKGLSGWR